MLCKKVINTCYVFILGVKVPYSWSDWSNFGVTPELTFIIKFNER